MQVRQMISEGFTDFQGYKIWYRIAKSATSGSDTPILLLHGGPGLGSDYLDPLEAMARQGRTVIRFDQLGCGRSDRPRNLSLWTIGSCMDQTDSVRMALGLDRIHLLGHSWGGMVALEYLLDRPWGVQSACLCSPVISVRLWAEEMRRLRSLMPSHISKALDRCEKSFHLRKPPEPGAKPARSRRQLEINIRASFLWLLFIYFSSRLAARIASWASFVPSLRGVAHEILGIQFYRRYACQLWPMPFGIFRALAGENKEINETLMGQSVYFCPGFLKDWDFRPRLPEICCPTLILSGVYDEVTPVQMAILREGIQQGVKERIKKGPNKRIADSEQIILEQSAHLGMWEEPDKYRAAILDFISRVESAVV